MSSVTCNHKPHQSQSASLYGGRSYSSELACKKDAEKNPAIKGIKAFLGTERTV